MATATCQTIAGPYSAAQPFKVRSYTCTTIAGALMSAGNVAWGGSIAKASRVDWIPGAHVPVLDDKGRMSQPWYRFFREVADKRLGGIDAPSVTEVATTTQQTQSQVLAVQTTAEQAVSSLQQVADTVNTVRDVAVQNDLAGSDQIQKLPSYKIEQLKRTDDP